jgi:hypothetical protein
VIEGVHVGDIPNKFMKPEGKFPFINAPIDATPAIFKQLLKNCSETKSTELNYWKSEISKNFLSN